MAKRSITVGRYTSFMGGAAGKSRTFLCQREMRGAVRSNTLNTERIWSRTLTTRAAGNASPSKEPPGLATTVTEQKSGTVPSRPASSTSQMGTTAKDEVLPSEPHPTSPPPAQTHTPSSTPSSASPSATTPQPPSKPPLHQRLGLLTTLFNAYGSTQRRRPYLTNFFAALVIYLLGDLSAQYLGSASTYDPQRTARNLTIGGIASIPAYRWFLYLSTSFNFPSKIVSIAVKVAVNQAVFAPTFNTYYFSMQALLSGATLEETWERVKGTVPTSVLNSFKLWPAVTAFNFTFVPMEYRAVFAGGVAIGWQTYLSWLNWRAEIAKGEREVEGIVDGALKAA
ncbi:hypothetical protein MMC10_007421 [Thelotrema lepadinum]|nr:hypothetical protein [Thelotrema lepadinum]